MTRLSSLRTFLTPKSLRSVEFFRHENETNPPPPPQHAHGHISPYVKLSCSVLKEPNILQATSYALLCTQMFIQEDPTLITDVRSDLQEECEKFGIVKKILVFDVRA